MHNLSLQLHEFFVVIYKKYANIPFETFFEWKECFLSQAMRPLFVYYLFETIG